MIPFIVLSLPRTRSTWLSKFLTYGDWVCGHDELQHTRTLEDIKNWFNQPNIGTVETLAAPWWRLIPTFAPNAKIVVIKRPVNEVVDSLIKVCPNTFNRDVLTKSMTYLDRKLDQLSKRLPNVLIVNFKDLNNQQTCAEIFEYCLGLPHDWVHWLKYKDQNIQTNLKAIVRYAEAYKDSFEKLGNAATQKILTQFALNRRVVEPTGIVIQSESFDTFLEDGTKLFEQHCTLVGEKSSQWDKKNIPLMRKLYGAGALQVTTARSNGRMFGYLVSLISPSLVSKDVLSGVHTTFYADPSFPGLGLKLQRAANIALKDKNVTEIIMQAGVRGSGDRIGSLYKRLGAEEFGQLYKLELN